LDLSSNARFHAVNILTEFDSENRRLSDIMKDYFDSFVLPSDIYPTITYLVQETTRWRGYLDYILSKQYHGRFHKIEYLLKGILRLGVYEILFREQVPCYASVSEAVELTRELVNEKASGLVNAILRQIQVSDKPDTKHLEENDSPERIAAFTSHPEWMIKRWLHHFGFQKTLRLCTWNNKTPSFFIRRNQIKIGQKEFESFLDQNRIQWKRKQSLKEFYEVDQIVFLKDCREFEMGLFFFQDPSAGLVTHLINTDKELTILDVCAAPGGKTTYLKERLGNKVTLYAYDSDNRRLGQLKENIKRLELNSIRIAQHDATKDNYPTADVILLDVPCTGTGVLAKRADLRWRRQENNVKEMQSIQKNILSHMSAFVQKEGKLLYTTCSLEPEENWDVVDSFLLENNRFILMQSEVYIPQMFVDKKGALFTFPPDHGLDGVFAVTLERIE